MLECITGRNSLKRNLEFIADSGLYSERNDEHTNNTIPHAQEHYMSDKHMVHAFSDNSLSSTSSCSGNSKDKEETTIHPDYYTAAQRTATTMSELTRGCGSEIRQCSDHCDITKQENVVSEDGGVADNH